MNVIVKHFVIGGAVGVGLAIPTMWLPDGVVAVLGGIGVVVAAGAGLVQAARWLGLADPSEEPYVEGRGSAPAADPGSRFR